MYHRSKRAQQPPPPPPQPQLSRHSHSHNHQICRTPHFTTHHITSLRSTSHRTQLYQKSPNETRFTFRSSNPLLQSIPPSILHQIFRTFVTSRQQRTSIANPHRPIIPFHPHPVPTHNPQPKRLASPFCDATFKTKHKQKRTKNTAIRTRYKKNPPNFPVYGVKGKEESGVKVYQ